MQGEYIYGYDTFGTLESVTNQDDITKTYSQNIAARTYTERQTGANYIYENIAHYDSNGYYTGANYVFTSSPHEGVNMPIQSFGRTTSVEYKSYLQGLVGSTTDGYFTSSYSYNAENFISGITQTLGEESVSTAYEYDENNRLTKVTVNGTIYRLTYDYMGNITAVTKNNAEYLTYSYDDAGRLISENNTEFSYRYSYTYDGNNNIASVTSIGTPTSNTPPFPPITSRPVATTYVYEGDKLVGIRGLGFLGNVIPYESDANGNLTDYGVYELTWTQGNKLEAVTNSNGTYRYSYDENGLRYKKESTVNSVTTETRYFLDGTTIIAEETGGALTQYYYDSTGVIGMRYNNENYYFVKDLFGNVHKVLHQDGTKVAQYEYDAWGNCETITNVNGMADINPFRYRGYYMDVETGYYYLQSRYYDPVLRRFISSDNYGLISTLAESGDINMFAYCGNNPVMYTDSTGQWIETVFDLFSLGASVVEIVINPANPWAWAGLIGDAVDLLPFVTGVGEGIRATKMVKYADDVIDASYDTIKFVKATDMVDDFSDGGKMLDDFAHLDDYYKSTVSNLRDGRTIHMMFMDNGMRIPNSKLRVDGLNEITNTIFELKPYNIQNARKGVKQILIYNDALGGGYKMIIVLY